MTTSAKDTTAKNAPELPTDDEQPRRTGGAAAIIAGSILVSRVFGIFRQSLMAAFLGATGVADAFTAAFRKVTGMTPSDYRRQL